MNNAGWRLTLAAAVSLSMLAGCGDGGDPYGGNKAAAGAGAEAVDIKGQPAAAGDPGRALYGAQVGGLSCAQCHSTSTEDHPLADKRFVGHSLRDSTRRPAWWYGKITPETGGLRDAVLMCVASFQQRSWSVLPVKPDGTRDLAGVEMEDADVDALLGYLESISRPGKHQVLLAKKDDTAVALRRVDALEGDAERGKEAYARSCAVCHSSDGSSGIGGNLRGEMQAPDRWRTIEYVRSGPTNSNRESMMAWMPWFTADVLSDQDLADIGTLLDGDDW